MHSLLKENGILAGLLFNRTFEKSPPFGGSLAEYESLFKAAFIFKNMATSHDSVAPRAESELFIELIKNEIEVQFYIFEGITCNGCRDTITTKIKTLSNVLNANISSDFSNLLVVSNGKIELATMQAAVAYDAKYKIAPYTK